MIEMQRFFCIYQGMISSFKKEKNRLKIIKHLNSDSFVSSSKNSASDIHTYKLKLRVIFNKVIRLQASANTVGTKFKFSP